MLVRDWMQREVMTLRASDPLGQAAMLLARRGIRHLPVVHEGRLVGLVSDRDLRSAAPSPTINLAPSAATLHAAGYHIIRPPLPGASAPAPDLMDAPQ